MSLSGDQTIHLTDALERERQQARELLHLLQQEYRLLRDNDPSGLTDTVEAKQRQLAKLDRASQTRQMVWGNAGPDHLHSAPVTALWQELRTLTRKCHDQNRLNGALLEQRRQHCQRVLAILSGQTVEQTTYGASGRTHYEPSITSRTTA